MASTEAQVPDRRRGVLWDEDARPDRETVGGPPRFDGVVAEDFPGADPEVFAWASAVSEYERRIAELERSLGKKEVEIALPKNFLDRKAL